MVGGYHIISMDFFNFGNLAACCTCNRKPDESWKTGGSAENEYYQRGGAHTDKNRPRIEKPQLGGVGIVFQGTEDGGLQVNFVVLPRFSPLLFATTGDTNNYGL